MFDIEKLEKEWERYDRKRRRPRYIMASVLLLIASLGYFAYTEALFQKIIGSTLVEKKDVTDPSSSSESVWKEHKLYTKLLEKNGTNMQVFPADAPMEKEDIFIETIDTKLPKPVVAKEERKPIHLEIHQTSSVDAYKDVERRFNEAPNVEDALFLAKAYFDKGAYKKSESWALKTNKLDPEIEESWLIFIQSKARLGEKNEALRVLTAYLKQHHSKEAEKLLESMQ